MHDDLFKLFNLKLHCRSLSVNHNMNQHKQTIVEYINDPNDIKLIISQSKAIACI